MIEAKIPSSECQASIRGSATPNGLFHQVKGPKCSSHKAFEKSGRYSKLPKVADAVIRAECHMIEIASRQQYKQVTKKIIDNIYRQGVG